MKNSSPDEKNPGTPEKPPETPKIPGMDNPSDKPRPGTDPNQPIA